jgi:hypothetical protein
MYTFNLWGDPSLTLEGIDLAGVRPVADDAQASGGIHLAVVPSPARDRLTISYYLPCLGCARLEVFDVWGRLLRSLPNTSKSVSVVRTEWSRKALPSHGGFT